jgi:hypothetical protein
MAYLTSTLLLPSICQCVPHSNTLVLQAQGGRLPSLPLCVVCVRSYFTLHSISLKQLVPMSDKKPSTKISKDT